MHRSLLPLAFCAWLVAGCTGAPANLAAVESSLRRTLRELEDPDLKQSVEAAWQAARRGDASSRSDAWSAFWGDLASDPSLEERLWADAVATARGAWLEQQARKDDAWRRWQAAREEAQSLRRQANALGPDLPRSASVAALRTVEVAWQRAERRAQAGDLAGAVAAAGESARAARQALDLWQASHARFQRPDFRRQWAEWSRQAIDDSRREGAAIVVDKLRRRLHLWRNGRLAATYDAELGRRGLERKLHSGDRATPEGRYRVVRVRQDGDTRYYKALLLDYPNPGDRARLDAAIRAGQVARGSKPGGLIEIHGHGGRGQDWTDGCVALRDEDMDALWPAVRQGLSVTIVGTLP